MQKTLYSLILMDEVVQAVDKLAGECAVSRSSLINRILAERLNVMTPELCKEQIFEEAKQVFISQRGLNILPITTNILSVRSVLPFKYNPAIKYKIELFDATAETCTGMISVHTRTQNETLLSQLHIFFELWSQLELTCILERFPSVRIQHDIKSGQIQRPIQLLAEQSITLSDIGRTIGEYVLLLRDTLSIYFSATDGIDMMTYSKMRDRYRAYLQTVPLIV